MKRVIYFSIMMLFTACKTAYYYYPPAPNNTFFANAGEVHVTGDAGISGVAWPNAKGGVAITNNISAIAMYGGATSKSYKSGEGEFGIGYNSDFDKAVIFSIYGGLGLGSNSAQDSGVSFKNFYGNFNKPFLQLTIGTGGEHAEAAFTIKADYINYNGYNYAGNNSYSGYKTGEFFWEPYFSGNAGGKHVRFQFGTGFAFRNISEIGKGGFRIFPWQFDIGIHLILNRKSE